MRRWVLTTLAVGVVLGATACAGDPGASSKSTVAGDTGYGLLVKRLPLETGAPLLVLGDLPLIAEAADVELPPPGPQEWQVDGLDRLSQHPPLPATLDGVGRALRRGPKGSQSS